MRAIAALRSLSISKDVRSRLDEYVQTIDKDRRLSIQLELWNKEWSRLIETVPYYRDLSKSGKVPSRFASWEEFFDYLPATSRRFVQAHGRELTADNRKPDFYRITGGSTAEPIQLPAWRSEQTFTAPDVWVARACLGITPASRLFLLWGHSHLLGSGTKGLINRYKRRTSDWLLGYYRFSAYDMRPEAMEEAARRLIRFKPEYFLGYGVALDAFAQANKTIRTDLRRIGLKVVIGAAEAFPAEDTAELLTDIFDCPVVMEYGSVETGMIAQSLPGIGYQVFWKTYFLEAENANDTDDRYTVRVTSLYPRCFPLIRYEMGDEIRLNSNKGRHYWGFDRFRAVLGRCNDYIELSDGTLIHSEAFTHAVRWCSRIAGYQVIQKGGDIRLTYTSIADLEEQHIQGIREKLKIIHPALGEIPVNRVDALQCTIAGKTRMILKS